MAARSLGRRIARSTARIFLGVLVGMLLLVALGWWFMIRMPGCSHSGPLPELTAGERDLIPCLQRQVQVLAGDIGIRNHADYEKLQAAAAHIEQEFLALGLRVERQEYPVDDDGAVNLIAEIPGQGRASEIVVVGAHYDSAWGTPGADDNASAVAGLLALARHFARVPHARTLRLVAFANEEPPFFQTERMGSLVCARAAAAAGDDVVAMVALEMLGFYSEEAGSQRYPFPLSLFYPSRGDFIAFVGNISSRHLVRDVVAHFREHTAFPSEGVATFAALPGIGFSDQWSFWQVGVPALMVTDTAFFRNPNYHEPSDRPDTLDYARMARVVAGLERTVAWLLTTERRWD